MIEFERKPQAYTIEFDNPRNPDIADNLKSLLGERFNVLVSRKRYTIIAGQIFAEGDDEPFLNVIKRGRDYRRGYPNPIDYKREDAEVMGFEKIQKELGDPQTPVGTMMISISPPGLLESAYQKNFYDIFTKTEWGIEIMRYSSALSQKEYAKFLLEQGFQGNGEIADDAFFLSRPFKVSNPRFKTPEDLHNFLFREHEYILEHELERIWKDVAPLALVYIGTVASGDVEFKKKTLNAFINGADMSHFFGYSSSKEDVYALGLMPARKVMTGCGSSGGASLGSSPFSVSEFGRKEWFKCPKCGWEASGPIGDGSCGGCGLTKEKFAKEGGKICA